MISLQTNVNSLVAQQNLSVNSAFQSKTIAQLTSGYRINQSGDDAAGLAVANQFRSTVAELTQGVANGNDATAQLQIMDGGISNISSILDRLKTLATQSASGTFTGNRATLNSEFQNALSEVDRQAQSIGLNSGGIFAKNLDVYMGTGSGSQTVQNGVVTLGLTQSAVDSQALGMKGMQAVGGTADLGNGTSAVSSIAANVTNLSTEASAGYATFSFSGAGYSDAGRVKVQVNLSGASDAASLVTAFNSAIGGAGTGSPQALAFAKANIVASVVTDSNGQHLGFTSSTSAFQIQAGDQMANALLGNFLGGVPAGAPVGAAITTTVTGGSTAAMTAPTTTTFAPGTNGVMVRIQGSGLAAPIDLHIAAAAGQVSDAITSLESEVSSSAQLAAAGISLTVVANQLQFKSATGDSFSVMATGDATNQLGLGSFAVSGAAPTAVDYHTITGATYNYGTANNDQATMEVSINGMAAVGLAPDLTAGDAVAAARTSTAIIANPTIVSSTASSTVGVTALATHDWSLGSETFTVAVNGGTAQNVVLNTSYTQGVAGNAALLLAINGQLSGATATIDSSSHLRITANTTGGAGGVVAIAGTVANIGATFTQTAATDGKDKLAFSVDGIAVSTTLDSLNNEHAVATGNVVGAGGLAITSATVSTTQGITLLATKDWSATPATFTVAVNGAAAQTIYLNTSYTNGAGDAALLTAINNQLVGATASIVTNHLKFTATVAGNGDNSGIVIGGTVADIGATWTTVKGANGNNKIMVSVDGGAAAEVDMLGGGATQTFAQGGLAGEVAALAAFNTGLTNAGLTGVTAAMDSTFHLTLTSSTVGGGSGVTVSDVTTGLDTFNSGMTATFGAATVSAHGTTTTAASIAVGIQAAIDAATGTGATNAHATVTLNNDNSISIINDHKGAGHTIGAFTGNAAATGIMGAGTVGAVAGLNRSGADLASYLNGVFATGLLQPAQLTATWNAGTIAGTSHPGTLTIASGNNTNFRVNSGTSATASLTTATNDLTAGRDFSGAAANAQAFQISSDGGTTWQDIVLNTSALGTTGAGAQKVVDALNAALLAQTAGVTASLVTSGANYYVKLASSTTGSTSSIQVQNQSAADATAGYSNALGAGKILDGLKTKEVTADANLGFGVSGASFQTAAIAAEAASANLTSTAPKNYVVDVGGASQALSTLTDPTTALAFSALQYGNDSQAITISANDVNGNQQSKTITLKNLATGAPTDNQAGRNIDQAVSYINQQLQSSNNATLQKIVAVKQDVAGVDKINFISSLASFNVGVGSTANADGVHNGASTNVVAGVVGAGANMAVDSILGAQAAVAALAAAIAQLGAAQAAVGKGQNQLSYAVSLAQSQITNFSAAESQIRDANVAQQAANLSKAQVLSQASIAAMAQANSAPQAVLSLLRG